MVKIARVQTLTTDGTFGCCTMLWQKLERFSFDLLKNSCNFKWISAQFIRDLLFYIHVLNNLKMSRYNLKKAREKIQDKKYQQSSTHAYYKSGSAEYLFQIVQVTINRSYITILLKHGYVICCWFKNCCCWFKVLVQKPWHAWMFTVFYSNYQQYFIL